MNIIPRLGPEVRCHLGTDEVWVVVPAHNEAHVLGDVLAALLQQFSNVVCIDDGSTDGSAAVASQAGAVVLRHGVNLGQGAALQTGFDFLMRSTEAAYVVTFDGDGQHDPDDAVRMVQVARDTGSDVVLGSRAAGQTVNQPASRRILLRLGVVFTRISTGMRVTDTHNGLRVLSRGALGRLRLTHANMTHASEMLNAIAASGLEWIEAPVTVSYTDYSRSKGQHSLNAFNILYDLAVARLRAHP